MSVAFLLSASSRVCRHHGSSPESQKACYKRISQSITDHRSQRRERKAKREERARERERKRKKERVRREKSEERRGQREERERER